MIFDISGYNDMILIL